MILGGTALRAAAKMALDPTPPVDVVSVDVHVPKPVTIPAHGYEVVYAEEYIDMPNRLAATITGRSSHMRDGVTMPGGVVDPGWSGDFALEFFNHSDEDYHLNKGEAAGRLTFFEVKL